MLAYKVLEDQGISLDVAGDELRLSPKEKVTAELIEFARAHKAEIISELKAPVIYCNPYPQGTTEARQESLLQIIYAIWEPTFDRVAAIWPNGFVSTQEISSAELEIERVQALVLSGKGKLVDFNSAVSNWERACTKEIENKGGIN